MTFGRWRELPWGAAAVVLLLAVAVGGHYIERRMGQAADELSPEEYAAAGAPWNAQVRGDVAARLMADGHLELSRAAIDDALDWNPGIDRLRRIQAIIRYEQGELDGEALVYTLEPGRSRFTSYLDIADRLIAHEEYELAAEVLEDVQTQMSRYGNWGVNESVMDAGIRQIVVAGELGGCHGAEAEAEDLRSLPMADFYSNADEAIDLAVARACA